MTLLAQALAFATSGLALLYELVGAHTAPSPILIGLLWVAFVISDTAFVMLLMKRRDSATVGSAAVCSR